MSEDQGLNRNRKKEEERRLAPDFFGSLGKGMLEKEDMRIDQGLTPLQFVNEIHDDNLNPSGLTTLHPSYDNRTLKKSSGLTPLRPDCKINRIRVVI